MADTLHRPTPHDSARHHVRGAARYVDDLPLPDGALQVHIAWSDRVHARILTLDLTPVIDCPGIVAVVGAAGVPGINEISPVHRDDEPLFAEDLVHYHGQPLFAVAASDIKVARRAARLARIVYEDLPPVLDVDAARAAGSFVVPPSSLSRGDASAGLAASPHRLQGRLSMGGQDHFYLEGQAALAIPGEGGDMLVHSSTQHPSETQDLVARVLGLPAAAVTVEVRRLGGGFGGKETQANLFACAAAVVAARTGRAAKCRPDRDDDMILTGKRHDFAVDYKVGFEADGRIRAVAMDFLSRCGWSADLSGPINDRALFHADNGYFYPDVSLHAWPCRTNTVSNTAFRGFGGPQGMLAAERAIDEIAFATGQDPLDVRLANLYGGPGRDVTPYHMLVEDNLLPELMQRLAQTSDYRARRTAMRAANATDPWQKRGLALTPVKFGISFTTTAFNQAGALIHIYKDGSIHLNHGGVEMGQGLFVKVAQVVAHVFNVPLERVRVSATTTGKVPNTSATAASSGSDLNGMAAQAAAMTLKERLTDFVAALHQARADEVAWLPERVAVKGNEIGWSELVRAAYLARVQLSATGFYKTPKIHMDRQAGRGRPFYYFAYGAACAETVVDTLTGEYRVTRVDILHDCGRSLNPAIDKGQIEGGFIQGMGWLTSEELVWDEHGRLRTHAPSTYKIPTAADRPAELRIDLFDAPNREATIHRSKAVGEPPFMLGMAVFHSLADAIAAVADYRVCPRLDAPATPERVLGAIGRLREQGR